MKLFHSILLVVLFTFNIHNSSGFTLSNQRVSINNPLQVSSKKNNNISAIEKESIITTNRRDSIKSLISFAITAFTTTSGVLLPISQAQAAREVRPEYLSEPTDEFKESERQRDEFRRKQLVIKKQFNDVLARLTFDSKTGDEIRDDILDLKVLVQTTGGLPLGIKKDEMVKIIRAKKAKGFWPTEVEYAYQGLIREIAYQQSPNKDKDTSNPL